LVAAAGAEAFGVGTAVLVAAAGAGLEAVEAAADAAGVFASVAGAALVVAFAGAGVDAAADEAAATVSSFLLLLLVADETIATNKRQLKNRANSFLPDDNVENIVVLLV